VERYNERYLRSHPRAKRNDQNDDPTVDLPFTAKDVDKEGTRYKAEFPWLYDPSRGRRWDFDPVELRVLAQENAWVQMMVQTIGKEIAETAWTITDTDSARETDKRLSTHPDERTPLEKDLPDATAERIFESLRDPNPDADWSTLIEQFVADYLEVGSMVGTKAFDTRAYADDGSLKFDADDLRPEGLQATAPEVWTKEYADKSGLLTGFWQFDRRSSPGGTDSVAHGAAEATQFETGEVLWTDHSPKSNRTYGTPPTLYVANTLQSLDLAQTQEQQYLSRGSIPSGAWVFEEWDREAVKEWKTQNQENLRGKPHKSLMFAGRGGDVKFEPMSMNFKELEFTDRMRWYARIVAAAFQVPTAVVGVEPEKVNYNTFQGERANFESNTLGPYLQQIERALNDQWVEKHWDGYRFEFTPGLSESTRGMIMDRVTSGFGSNLLTRNEARRALGQDPVDESEDGFKDDVVEGSDDPEGGVGELLASATVEKDDPDDASERPLRNTDDALTFDVQPSDVDDLYADIADDVRALFDDVLGDERIEGIIEALATETAQGTGDTEKSSVDLLRRLKEIIAENDTVDRIRDAVQSHASEEIRETLESTAADVDADIDTDPIAQNIQERDVAFADEFADRMASEIRETVSEGWEAGKNSDEIGRELQDKADEFGDWQAERIARQEMHVAAGEARREFAEEAGKVEVWMDAGDDRVRDAHAEMNETWKYPGDEWVVDYDDRGTVREPVQGDSEPGIGCRCTTLLVDRDTVDAADYGGADGP
jgi:hypothetical protein